MALPCVVSSHARFLEYQDRRRRPATVTAAPAAPLVADDDADDAGPTLPMPAVSEADSKT